MKKLEQEDPHFFADVKGKAKYTLLLPTNAAMNAFLEEYAQVDLSGVNLTTLVKHHFLIDPVEFRTFRSTYYVAMNREILPATRDLNNCVSFGNGGRIVLADDFCSNGIIHLIDKVLIPTRNFN
ncbi:MAG: fasciclin domain-containing protein [Bacteroidetes bacterium]|nr:MAG: fasciclin domain-containing protein [Bacteroidota bacterium]